MSRIADAVQRLKHVCLEGPGSRITRAHLAEVSGLDAELCDPVIAAFEDAAFLRRARNGDYTLDAGTPRPRRSAARGQRHQTA